MKLVQAEKVMNDEKEYYYDMFKFATIRIEQIYPSVDEWTLYDTQPEIISHKLSTPMPVSLFNPISGKYTYGVLYVEVYT